MNTEEVHALRQVIEYHGHAEYRHWQDAGEPPDHIAEAFLTLNKYRQARSSELDNESLVRAAVASKPGDWTKDAAESLGCTVRDQPSRDEGQNSQGPSVVSRGSKEIEWRWAKETIGLAALELNEAYAELDIESHGQFEIPSGTLYQVKRRLEEAMERFGIADPDREIPF